MPGNFFQPQAFAVVQSSDTSLLRRIECSNMEVDNNQQERSILAGFDFELAGPFDLHQAWKKLLTGNPAILQQTALITSSDGSLSFDQLDRRATELARKLLTHYRRPDGGADWVIAVCLRPSTELIVSLLAIFKLGAAYLPLDPTFPSNRVAHILGDAKPALLLTSSSVLEDTHFDRIQENLPVFRCDHHLLDGNGDCVQLAESQPHKLAVVLYTSGSTGMPKGVRLTHSNIYHRLHWQWRTFPYAEGEIAAFKTALTFVDSIAEIWAPLLKGIPIVVVPKTVTQNPERFINTLETFKVTRLVLVPSLLSSILSYVELNKSKDLLRRLKLWVCSGEVLPVHLLAQFYQLLNGVVCNFYGSTEITGDVTSVIFRNQDEVESTLFEGRVPLGSALDNCAVYVLNSMGEPVERGQIGEVFISGAHVADGYIGKSDANASFVANLVDNRKGHEILYRTGDFGRIVNGMLYYEGRADSQIKIRGHRVDLTEINAMLHQVDQVEKGVVLCWKPGQPEQEIVAFVVSNNPSTIHQSLKEKLVSYAMPRIVIVDEIPLLVNGKIDRQQLLRDYAKIYKNKPNVCKWNENELNRLDERARHMACALFKTVSSVLGGSLHKSLSLADNYFYVGGNSLNAVIVVTKLRDQGFFLELGDFLEAENFQQLVYKMEESKCNGGTRPFCQYQQQNDSEYKIEKLNSSVKTEVIRMMCECFSQKGDLELLTGVTYEDYEALVPDLWDPILNANLSFVVKNGQDRVVACGMNCDAYNVPELNPKAARLGYVFEVLEQVKGPFRESLVDGKKGRVLQNFLVATDGVQLTPAENVALVQFVEQETLSLAKRNGFQFIFTSNSSPLTQQICNDVLDYEILSEYQVNQFVASDGTKPFAQAPDSLLITISVKNL